MDLSRFAHALDRIETTDRREAATSILAELFTEADAWERDVIIPLSKGRLGPQFRTVPFGMGERLLVTALARTYDANEEAVRATHRETGDLGTVAERLAAPRQDGAGPPIREVYQALESIARTSGTGSQMRKVDGLASLLERVGPSEARHLVRIVQGRLRLGVGDATLIEAIALGALGDTDRKSAVERAYNLRSDLAAVARIAYERGEAGLRRVRPEAGTPIRPALAQRAASVEELARRLPVIQAEPKYDGFRLQLHRTGDRVQAFSRRLEDVSDMFPELADALRRQLVPDPAILDGEAIGYDPDTGEFPPFQITMKRKRKRGVREAAERQPLRYFAFDLLLADDVSLIDEPLRERRRRLERALRTEPDAPIDVAEVRTASETAPIRDYFDEMVARGLEGIVAKRPESHYPAGARSYEWIKLKRHASGHLGDTLDVVIVGYLTGRGKRAPLGIGSLLGAVYDPERDRFRTVAKVGSGPSHDEWRSLKARLDRDRSARRPRRVDSRIEPDVWIEPRLVVVVEAEEITRSPSHTCGREADRPGYALRFPRVVEGPRGDKAPEDATTEAEVLQMYRMQRPSRPQASRRS